MEFFVLYFFLCFFLNYYYAICVKIFAAVTHLFFFFCVINMMIRGVDDGSFQRVRPVAKVPGYSLTGWPILGTCAAPGLVLVKSNQIGMFNQMNFLMNFSRVDNYLWNIETSRESRRWPHQRSRRIWLSSLDRHQSGQRDRKPISL